MQNKPIKTIFVCEFITGGGLHDSDLHQGLLKQGQDMRDALLRDLFSLPYQVITTVDSRLHLPVDCQTCHLIEADDDVWGVWEEIIASVDAVWLIAPETDGELTRLTSLATQYDKWMIGSALHAVMTFSSKLATYDFLNQNGVDTVATFLFAHWPKTNGVQWLAKPDDGAGCEQTVCFDSAALLSQWLVQHQQVETHVIQPYLTGIAGSISCVMNKGKAYVLSCNKQEVAMINNQLMYQGCIVNGLQQYWSEFTTLASQIAKLQPDLMGYVGIDVIVSNDEFGDVEITTIEINPRLTTSYIALSEATGYNPAELIMNTLLHKSDTFPQLQKNEVTIKEFV